MSKSIMWADTDSRGFESECLFNEDSRTCEVMVCTSGRPRVDGREALRVPRLIEALLDSRGRAVPVADA